MAIVIVENEAPGDGSVAAQVVVLNNPSAALMFALLVTLLTSVGMRRFPQPNPSAVPR